MTVSASLHHLVVMHRAVVVLERGHGFGLDHGARDVGSGEGAHGVHRGPPREDEELDLVGPLLAQQARAEKALDFPERRHHIAAEVLDIGEVALGGAPAPGPDDHLAVLSEAMTKPSLSEIADIDAVRRALAPAAEGAVSFRVESAAETGGTVALIHVFNAYVCKGTEAEVTGLLAGAKLPWRIVWH